MNKINISKDKIESFLILALKELKGASFEYDLNSERTFLKLDDPVILDEFIFNEIIGKADYSFNISDETGFTGNEICASDIEEITFINFRPELTSIKIKTKYGELISLNCKSELKNKRLVDIALNHGELQI